MDEQKKPAIILPDKGKPADIGDKMQQPGSDRSKGFVKWNPPGDFVAPKRSFWMKVLRLFSGGMTL